ncbi:MAG: selenide, water dikinase SelD [Candidatus Lokiarchaeota archaeon]|nr:selenide, water dikinase SelD [Candidatus Lokiarchaeota archaeon]
MELIDLLKGLDLKSINMSEVLLKSLEDDAAVIPVNDKEALIQSIDIFTPIHDDPIIQGKITACNALNDIYAMGISKILSVLAFIAMPNDMPFEIGRKLMQGFSDFCKNDGTYIVGGQTIHNPEPLLGGAVTGFGLLDKIIYLKGAKVGDSLILTKPLGIQPAMAAYRIKKVPEFAEILHEGLTKTEVQQMIDMAVKIMTTSNKPVARALENSSANAATDVTGFGLHGHSSEMIANTKLDIFIQSLPVIKGALVVSDMSGYRLEEGHGHETAGGMLMAVSDDQKDQLLAELKKFNVENYEIGIVIEGTGKFNIAEDAEILEISKF